MRSQCLIIHIWQCYPEKVLKEKSGVNQLKVLSAGKRNLTQHSSNSESNFNCMGHSEMKIPNFTKCSTSYNTL